MFPIKADVSLKVEQLMFPIKQYGMKINKDLTKTMLHSRIIAYLISGFVF